MAFRNACRTFRSSSPHDVEAVFPPHPVAIQAPRPIHISVVIFPTMCTQPCTFAYIFVFLVAIHQPSTSTGGILTKQSRLALSLAEIVDTGAKRTVAGRVTTIWAAASLKATWGLVSVVEEIGPQHRCLQSSFDSADLAYPNPAAHVVCLKIHFLFATLILAFEHFLRIKKDDISDRRAMGACNRDSHRRDIF